MAIIYSYPLNDDIKPLDELVGTTEKNINGQLKTVTRNFLLSDIAEFLIIDGGIQKTLTLTTNGTSGVSTLDQVTGILNIPHYPGELKVASLFKETFEYTSSDSFTLINTINNVLQVIVNTTSLHPVAYSVELPNIVNVLNQLYPGDTITIIYNYLEEVVETPNLQSVTDEGDSTTNQIEAQGFIKAGGLSTEFLMADGSTSNASPFTPSDYDLDEFTNAGIDPFAHVSDIANKENSANKQNSLAVDGTGTKFPTVDAVNAGISSANYWTKTGNDIVNNNTLGYLNLRTGTEVTYIKFLDSSDNLVGTFKSDSGIFVTKKVGGGFSASDEGTGMTFPTNNVLFRSYNGGANRFTFLSMYNTDTTGTVTNINTATTVNPTSGNANFTEFNISPTINQTGGANGITRGLYINPTLTSAADFRAIEVTAGKVIVPTAANSNEAINKGQLESYTTAQLAGKMNNPSLTASYIPRALTSTTIGNSRIVDTDTYLGIGTVNTPTKDITLGYQFDREIGIELSSNTVEGKTLTISAGKTINYVPNTNFNSLNQTTRNWIPITVLANNDVYAGVIGGLLYVKTAATSTFLPVVGNLTGDFDSFATAVNGTDIYAVTYIYSGYYKLINGVGPWIAVPDATVTQARGITVAPNGDVYIAGAGTGLFKQTGGIGSFAVADATARQWWGLTAAPNGDIYASENVGDWYKQTGGTGSFVSMGFTARGYVALRASTNGNIYGCVPNGNIYMYNGSNLLDLGQNYGVQWRGLASDTNGNMYATAYADNIYLQANDTLGTPNLQGGTLKLNSGTGKGTGASDIEMYTGQVLASGTDMQIETLRAKINNTGLMTLPSVTNALIDADTTGKAVVTKEYVNNKISTYNTYFVNSVTGNNTTGVFQDANKPFATIDYINANFTITDGTIFYLQGTGQTYLINNQLQAKKQSIIADEGSTNILDFSSNTNASAMVTGGSNNVVTIKMPNGVLRCERSGGTGVSFTWYEASTLIDLNVREIYWNTSTNLASSGGNFCRVKADKISARTVLLQFLTNDIIVQEFICLANNTSLSSYGYGITINLISGSGNYALNMNNDTNLYIKYIIGDVTATGGINFGVYLGGVDVTFNNSTINIFNFSSTNNVSSVNIKRYVRGTINSITTFSGTVAGLLNFTNFRCNLNTGSFNIPVVSTLSNLIFENCSIKSTNSPITLVTSAGTSTIEIKNCAFEVVNAVPLVTGGAGGTNTLKIAGLSTNATVLSDQNGTGVTVNVIGKQVVADGVDSKDAINKGQLDSKRIQRLAQYTVATLPTGAQGDTAYVTDAMLPTYLGTVTGGGSVVCKVFYNGTNWIT